MKKAEQIKINGIVEDEYELMKSQIDNDGVYVVGQFRSCKAEVLTTPSYTLLRSYNTIVAAVDKNGFCFDFLRFVYGYTATSAQQIAKFFNDYAPAHAFRWVWRAV